MIARETNERAHKLEALAGETLRELVGVETKEVPTDSNPKANPTAVIDQIESSLTSISEAIVETQARVSKLGSG